MVSVQYLFLPNNYQLFRVHWQ